MIRTETLNEKQRSQMHVEQISEQITRFQVLQKRLQACLSVQQKLNLLRQNSEVRAQSQVLDAVQNIMGVCSEAEEMVLLQLCAIGQAKIVFARLDECVLVKEAIGRIISQLLTLDCFYACLGGVIGYHSTVLELIRGQLLGDAYIEHEERVYYAPPYHDIRKETQEVCKNILSGIQALNKVAQLYVVGGAGERLNLMDQITGQALPAAKLLFCGKTMLQNLVEDLQAREYMYYHLYQKQVTVPIILMTSEEKNNDSEIASLLEAQHWFLRSKDSFLRIIQPQIPVVTIDGNWAVGEPLTIMVKPGGHGVVWKLLDEHKGFQWLQQQEKEYLMIRQVNNPLAGLDYGMFATLGYGVSNNKLFGFASCNRCIGAAEGVNVLMEDPSSNGYIRALTNVEYTDFARHAASLSGELPANTNILFGKISALEEAQKKLPIPGMIVNLKHSVRVWDDGEYRLVPGSRLESTMQNIAECISECCKNSYAEDKREHIGSYITFNAREKTISVTKKSFIEGNSMFETPEGAFYDLIYENVKLLTLCGMDVCTYSKPEEYLQCGPSPLFLYHPALGPLYSVIKQKIRGGKIAQNAELCLDVAEVNLCQVNISGSMRILSRNPLGITENGSYSEACGRCTLYEVVIQNQGIDRDAKNCFWKNEIYRHESCEIILEGNSEFEAEHVVFSGPFTITVPHNTRCIARQTVDGGVDLVFQPMKTPSWKWVYSIMDNTQIALARMPGE